MPFSKILRAINTVGALVTTPLVDFLGLLIKGGIVENPCSIRYLNPQKYVK